MDLSPETPFQRAKADGLSWKMTLTLAAPCAEQGHRLPPNESTARGCEAGTKISIVESSIRGRLKIISGRCLGKTFVAHGPCGHEVPELLQEEKSRRVCAAEVHRASLGPGGTPLCHRGRAGGSRARTGQRGLTALPQLPLRPVPACSGQALMGNSSATEKNIVMRKWNIIKLACCQRANTSCW